LAAGFLAGAFVAAGFTALAAGFAALGAALAAGFAALAATLGAALAAGFAAAFLAGAFFAAIDSHLPSVPMGHSDEIQKDRTENPNRQIRETSPPRSTPARCKQGSGVFWLPEFSRECREGNKGQSVFIIQTKNAAHHSSFHVGPDRGFLREVMTLPEHRQSIDAIDRQIVQLLNERTQHVLGIGSIKMRQGQEIYAPHRERAVLQKICKLNQGPITNEGLRAIYREVMSSALSLEKSLTIAYLGPEATFTHEAAIKRFGSSL